MAEGFVARDSTSVEIAERVLDGRNETRLGRQPVEAFGGERHRRRLSVLRHDEPSASARRLALGAALWLLSWSTLLGSLWLLYGSRQALELWPLASAVIVAAVAIASAALSSRRLALSPLRALLSVAALALANAAVGALLLWQFSPVALYQVPTPSMVPAIYPGEVIAAERSFAADSPARNDIVVFTRPGAPDTTMVKRVIGLPGEALRVCGKGVFVDGGALDEPRAVYRERQSLLTPTPSSPNDCKTWHVPSDAVFVMGDNRNESEDSRVFGPVARSALRGKALYVMATGDEARVGVRFD